MSIADSLGLGFSIGKQLWLRRRPFLLYLKPTPRCDCRCQSCNRWQMERPERELSTEEIAQLLTDFHARGCRVLTLWGGEPTLRADLGVMLERAQALGYRTSICTNARRLADKAAAIVPHLDVLLTSLDGLGELHDQMRGIPGLFERVLAGIEAARRVNPGCNIKVWASVHPRNLHQLREMAALARELSVGIEFFPLSTIGGYNDALLLGDSDRREAFATVRQLQEEGYPVRNPPRALKIMAGDKPMACNFGRISIHVDHEGQIYSCENARGEPLHLWGRYGELDLDRLLASEELQAVGDRLRSCNQCQLPCSVELSGNLTAALGGMFMRSLRLD